MLMCALPPPIFFAFWQTFLGGAKKKKESLFFLQSFSHLLLICHHKFLGWKCLTIFQKLTFFLHSEFCSLSFCAPSSLSSSSSSSFTSSPSSGSTQFPTNNAPLVVFWLSSRRGNFCCKAPTAHASRRQNVPNACTQRVRVSTELPFCTPPLLVGVVHYYTSGASGFFLLPSSPPPPLFFFLFKGVKMNLVR